MNEINSEQARLGIALGSGSARGWAHIGVLRELADMGIKPDIVSGTSAGALVGAVYSAGYLDEFEEWVLKLDSREVIKLFDVSLFARGGLIEGTKLLEFLSSHLQNSRIEELPLKFGAVTTDLQNGEEIWLRTGSVLEAIRASIAIPGFFTPGKVNNRLMVDGALVNPIPVSLCQAMGARQVIAVNLNGHLVGRIKQRLERDATDNGREAVGEQSNGNESGSIFSRLSDEIKSKFDSTFQGIIDSRRNAPNIFEIMSDSISIMQNRISRNRLVNEAPTVIITPRLSQITMLEFDRAKEAIAEGRESVRRVSRQLENL